METTGGNLKQIKKGEEGGFQQNDSIQNGKPLFATNFVAFACKKTKKSYSFCSKLENFFESSDLYFHILLSLHSVFFL